MQELGLKNMANALPEWVPEEWTKAAYNNLDWQIDHQKRQLLKSTFAGPYGEADVDGD